MASWQQSKKNKGQTRAARTKCIHYKLNIEGNKLAYTVDHGQIYKKLRPGQMQAPDFTTSAFKSSMTLRLLHLGNKTDDELHSAVAEPHCTTASVLTATRQQR